eukprot:TRINITY_DN26688_c0_g1_i2.p1 TRINITY_DN26688_c0_g1~~TRINITY_DN26688_c0_g1_i2.p1  ORF type:complete len:246 (-),score=48.79 TRINITY_DN26688_c0_g1_i2:215-952(-)
MSVCGSQWEGLTQDFCDALEALALPSEMDSTTALLPRLSSWIRHSSQDLSVQDRCIAILLAVCLAILCNSWTAADMYRFVSFRLGSWRERRGLLGAALKVHCRAMSRRLGGLLQRAVVGTEHGHCTDDRRKLKTCQQQLLHALARAHRLGKDVEALREQVVLQDAELLRWQSRERAFGGAAAGEEAPPAEGEAGLGRCVAGAGLAPNDKGEHTAPVPKAASACGKATDRRLARHVRRTCMASAAF